MNGASENARTRPQRVGNEGFLPVSRGIRLHPDKGLLPHPTGFFLSRHAEPAAHALAFLRLVKALEGRFEEEYTQDDKEDEELDEYDAPEGTAPGHLSETVAVETPHSLYCSHRLSHGHKSKQKGSDRPYTHGLFRTSHAVKHIISVWMTRRGAKYCARKNDIPGMIMHISVRFTLARRFHE